MAARNLNKANRRARFHRLTTREVRRLTSDSIEVTFAVPDELSAEFAYAPGQYVALRAEFDGREVRRSYSICHSPCPGELRIAIKRDVGGVFSTWANSELAAGMTMTVMSPQGNFTTDLDLAEGRHYAAIVAGSGITPVMALVRTILGGTTTARFTLVYSNRTALDVMFLEELADLKDKYPSRLALHHVLSREERGSELLSGRIDQAKLDLLLGGVLRIADIDEWFLCGPFDLVEACRAALAVRGVAPGDIRFELFSAGRPDLASAGSVGRPVVEDTAGVYSIEFTLDGRTATVTSPIRAEESVLNAALRIRSDVPFACAGGVCGTCRARLVTGSVHMTENYALEPDELANGYILTCQSHPTTERITVDFDA